MKNINETAVTDTETVNTNVVIFDTPLMRGEQKIEQVTLTKPDGGYRGDFPLAAIRVTFPERDRAPDMARQGAATKRKPS